MTLKVENIAYNLREIRTSKDISTYELAAKIGKSPSLISRYETGSRCPTVDSLLDLAHGLDVSIIDLLKEVGLDD